MTALAHVPLEDLIAEIDRRREIIYRVDTDGDTRTIQIIDAVAAAWGVSPWKIMELSRVIDLVEARQCAMYLLRQRIGYTFERIARIFRVHHATIQHSCKVVQDKIDNYDERFLTRMSTVKLPS